RCRRRDRDGEKEADNKKFLSWLKHVQSLVLSRGKQRTISACVVRQSPRLNSRSGMGVRSAGKIPLTAGGRTSASAAPSARAPGNPATGQPVRCARLDANTLFAQVLKGHLDAFIIELLIVGAKLLAAVGCTIEELDDLAYRSVRLPFEPGRAANVNGAIKIEVVGVVKELAHLQTRHRLVADAEHL